MLNNFSKLTNLILENISKNADDILNIETDRFFTNLENDQELKNILDTDNLKNKLQAKIKNSINGVYANIEEKIKDLAVSKNIPQSLIKYLLFLKEKYYDDFINLFKIDENDKISLNELNFHSLKEILIDKFFAKKIQLSDEFIDEIMNINGRRHGNINIGSCELGLVLFCKNGKFANKGDIEIDGLACEIKSNGGRILEQLPLCETNKIIETNANISNGEIANFISFASRNYNKEIINAKKLEKTYDNIPIDKVKQRKILAELIKVTYDAYGTYGKLIVDNAENLINDDNTIKTNEFRKILLENFLYVYDNDVKYLLFVDKRHDEFKFYCFNLEDKNAAANAMNEFGNIRGNSFNWPTFGSLDKNLGSNTIKFVEKR